MALVCAVAPAAHAQNEKRQAKKHLRDGDRALKKGDRFRDRGKEEQAIEAYEQAIADYKAAYELVPNPKIFYPIAQAEERLGLDLEALVHYQQILEEAASIDDNFRAQVELAIDAVKQRLVVLTLTVEPAGATVTVDGNEVGAAPLAKPVYLIPGEHAVVVAMEGFKPYESTAEYEVGEKTEEIFLEKKVVAQPVVVEEPKPKPKPVVKANPGRKKLIAGISVAGGFAAVAVVTGVMASGKHGDFEDTSLPADERESARDSGKTLALVTDICWVGAIGVGAYTAYYYYTDYKPQQERERRRAERRAVWVTPYATGEGAGVAVGGAF